MRAGLTSLYPSLATQPYRRLWLGIVPYQFAFFAIVVTTGLAAVALADSVFMFGLVVGAWGLPVLFMPLVGGVAADRFSRRRTMLLAQVVLGGAALVVGLLSLAGLLAAWHLIVLGLVMGTTYSFFAPARTAYTAHAVPRPLVPNAIAAYSLSEYTAAVTGPALTGLVLGYTGADLGWSYLAIAAVHGGVLAVFWGLPDQPTAPPEAGVTAWHRLVEGVRYVASTPPMPRVVVLAALVTFLAMPYQQLMPVFADRVFLVGPAGLGILLAASGMGAVCGALVAARVRGPRVTFWQRAFGAGFGLAVLAYALSPTFPVGVALAVLAGVAASAFAIVNYSLIITESDSRLYGRVASIYQMTFALGPLGAVPVAAVADLLGAPAAVALGGALATGVVLLLARGIVQRSLTHPPASPMLAVEHPPKPKLERRSN